MFNWFDDKLKNKYFHCFISALITAVMFLAFLVVDRIAPFGERFWFVYDMNKQYLDFYSYYRTVFGGENNLFYSTSISLGSASMGFFTYYLSSPWLLLTLLFKKTRMHYAVTLMIGIKIVLASLFCDLFLSHYVETSNNENEARVRRLIFSVAYSFCTFMLSNALNPMWLDVLYLMPLVIHMLDRLMFEGKRKGYIFALALMVLNNYYIAYMVCIFIVMWTLFRMFAQPCDYGERGEKKGPVKMLLSVAVNSVWAILLDAVFLIPTVYELSNSPKDIFKLGLETNKGNLALGEILSKLFFISYDSMQTITGTPLLYVGLTVIVLTILYFMNSRISPKEKIGMGVMMAVFLVSFAIDKINLLWHAGMEPSGYPYREAFLFVFLCLICGMRCICNFETGISRIKIIIAAAVMLGILGYVAYIGDRLFYVTPRMIAANIVLIIVTAVILLAIKTVPGEKNAAFLLGIILCLIQFGELLGNGLFVFKAQTNINEENSTKYIGIVSNIDEDVKKIKSKDNSFYRMENLSPRDRNDTMMFGYSGITHYSSSGSLYARELLQKMGYNDDGLYSDYGYNNTASADVILGVKYLIGSSEQSEIHPQYTVLDKDEDSVIKENPNVFGPAVFMMTTKADTDNPFALQRSLLETMTGTDGEVFVPVSFEECDDSIDTHSFRECRCMAEHDGEVYFYLQGIEDRVQNMLVYVDDELISGYGNFGSMKVLNLGYHKEGEAFVVRIDCESGNADFGETLIYTEDADRLCECCESCSRINVTRKSSSKYELVLPKGYENIGAEGIMITFPYEKGWIASCGGEDIPIQMCLDSMLFIKADDIRGNVIELNFIPEGFNLGLLISILAVLLLIGECVLQAYRTRHSDSGK